MTASCSPGRPTISHVQCIQSLADSSHWLLNAQALSLANRIAKPYPCPNDSVHIFDNGLSSRPIINKPSSPAAPENKNRRHEACACHGNLIHLTGCMARQIKAAPAVILSIGC
jgi:hypothetical protein